MSFYSVNHTTFLAIYFQIKSAGYQKREEGKEKTTTKSNNHFQIAVTSSYQLLNRKLDDSLETHRFSFTIDALVHYFSEERKPS